MSFSDGSAVKNPPANTCSISGWGDSLEKEMATHSAILAWEIPWREKPCGLQSMESQKSRRNFVTKQQESYLYLVNS